MTTATEEKILDRLEQLTSQVQNLNSSFLVVDTRISLIESNMATKSDIAEMATKSDIGNMATKSDIAEMATKSDIGNMATKTDIAEMATKSDIANMATKTDIADLESRMATKTDIAEIAATLRSEMATKTDLTNMAITLRSEMHTMGAEIVSTLSTAFDAKFVEQHQNMMTLYEQQNEKFTVLATEIGLMNKKLDTIIKKETQTDGVILSLDIRKVDRNELKSEVFI